MEPDASPFEDVVIEAETARATVRSEHARALCAGHFPGDPFVPGAYLAGLMSGLAALWLSAAGLRCALTEIERCVFLARVTPDAAIEVTVGVSHDETTRVAAEVLTHGACAARATLSFRSLP